jgi:dienelactone hydrolase
MIVDLKTADGVMATHTFRPEGDGRRYPVVLVYMDGVGIRDVLIRIGRRIASQGYYVAMPNPSIGQDPTSHSTAPPCSGTPVSGWG